MTLWAFIDPSSTGIGWCMAELATTGATVKAAGRIYARGKVAKLRTELKIDMMVLELNAILCKHIPKYVVIETPSGKINTRRHRGRGSGLSIYGMAVGQVRQKCLEWAASCDACVRAVTETEWTGGFGKDKHVLIAKRVWPRYKAVSDPGFDIADAISMAEWWATVRLRKVPVVVQTEDSADTVACFLCPQWLPAALITMVPFRDRKVPVCTSHMAPPKKKKGKISG